MKNTKKVGLYVWSEDFQEWLIMRIGTPYQMRKLKILFEKFDKNRNVKSEFKICILK